MPVQIRTNFLPPTLFANIQNSYCDANHKESDKTYEFIPTTIDKSTFQYIFFPNSAGAFSINESYAHNSFVRFSEQKYIRLDKEIVPFSLYDELLSVYYDKHSCQTKDISPQKLIEFEKECKQYRSLFNIKGSTHSVSLDNIIHNIVDSKWIISAVPENSNINKSSSIKETVKLVLHYKSFVLDVAITMHFNYNLKLTGFSYKPESDVDFKANWNSDSDSESGEEEKIIVPKKILYKRPFYVAPALNKYNLIRKPSTRVLSRERSSGTSEDEIELSPDEYNPMIHKTASKLFNEEEEEEAEEFQELDEALASEKLSPQQKHLLRAQQKAQFLAKCRSRKDCDPNDVEGGEQCLDNKELLETLATLLANKAKGRPVAPVDVMNRHPVTPVPGEMSAMRTRAKQLMEDQVLGSDMLASADEEKA